MRRLGWIGITLTSALWLNEVAAVTETTSDVVLVLDNSGSMKKNDPGFAVKVGVASLLDGVEGDTRVAVLVFDQGVRLALPFTPRAAIATEALREGLSRLDYRGRYTDIPAALDRAISELKSNGRPEAQKSIVVLTDGVIDTGKPEDDREGARWLREELAADASRRGIRLYAVAVGEKADFKLLHSLVQNTGGEYYRAEGRDELADALARIGPSLAAVEAQQADLPSPAAVVPAQEPEEPASMAAQDQPVESSTPSADAMAPPLPQQEPEGSRLIPNVPSAPDAAVDAPTEDQTGQAEIPAATEVPSADFARDWGPWLAGLVLLLLSILVLVRRKGARVSTAEQVFASQRNDARPIAFLHDLRDATGQTRHALTMRTTLVGRTVPAPGEDADHLLLERPEISCRHATIEYKRLAFWLTDQESTNGTFVNGQRVTGKVRLKHGDRIRFHNLEFEFNWPEEDAAAAKTRIVDAQGIDAHRQARPGPAAIGTRIVGNAAVAKPAAASVGDSAPPKSARIFPSAGLSPRVGAAADRGAGRPESGPRPAGAPESAGDPSKDPAPEAAKAKSFDDSLTLPSAKEVKRALNDYFEE